MLKDAAHNAVLARVQGNTHNATVAAVTLILYVVDRNRAVLKLNAFHHLLHIFAAHGAVAFHLVYLIDIRRGMGQLAGHLAVVCEEQQSCRVFVQAAHGIDAFLAASLHQQHHCVALLRVVECRDVALWFVKQKVAFRFTAQNFATV